MNTSSRPALRRRLLAIGLCLGIALAGGYGATSAFKTFVFRKHRAELATRTKALHDKLASITIDSRVMGATILLGLIQPTIKLAVSGTTLTESDRSEIHDLLEPLRRQFDALGTYLIKSDGLIVIHDTEGTPSNGLNVRFRPYFQAAMAGRPNVYAAVGSQSAERGLYYAAPVHAGALRSTPVIGVVLTKLSGATLDNLLSASGSQAVLLSPQGVAFAATRSDWLYAMTPPASRERVEAIKNKRRFGRTFDENDPRLLPFVPSEDTARIDGREYGLDTATLAWADPDGAWTLVNLEDTAEWFPMSRRLLVGGCAGGVLLLLGLAAMLQAESRRRRARRAARFRTLGVALEVSPLAVVITDASNRIQWINPRFEQVTLFGLDEVKGRDPSILASGQTAPETYEAMWRSLRSGQPWMGEFLNRRKDGTTYHARVSISPVSDATGRLLGYVGLQEDITEHNRLLSKLKSQLWLNEGLTAFASVIQNRIDPVALATVALAELVRFLALPYGAIHVESGNGETAVLARFGGTWHDEALPPDNQALVRDVLRSGRPLVLRDLPPAASVALAGGAAGLAQIRLLPLGEGQAPVGLLEIGLWREPNDEEERFLDKARSELALAMQLALDVSHRITAQKALADQLAFQQVLLDTIPNPVFYKGADTRFLGFNRAYEETFDVRREDLIGKRVLDLDYLPEADRLAYQREDEDTIASGNAVRREMRIPFADGKPHETLYYVSGFRKADGSPGGLVGTFVDISEQKDVERALAAAKEAAVEATLLKSDFLANMSHEIRTPMNAIIGMAHLALKTELTPRQRDYMTKIRQSSQHLLGILNDILDFSKIEAGKLSVEHTDFDLSSVLENVATLIREKAEAKGLELIFDLAADVPQNLIGDPLRLGQILINYANNAVKFTETGEIDIRVRLVEQLAEDVVLRFEVRDTGIGLSEHQIGRLFQSFSQADTSTTRKYGGTGLGLAISMRLAELMHGEVGVESTLGVGSTFWFTARLGLSHKKLRVLVPNPDLRGRPMLVVDDNENARAVVADMLASMQFTVDTAGSGAEAIERARRAADRQTPYDVIFLDWQMPGMDGIETASRIRAMGLAPSPHLIMVTAFGREEVLKSATDTGFDAVLIKPVTASLLFDAVMRTLGASGDEDRQGGGDGPDHNRRQDLEARRGARILLVEDNEINQQVAAELLTDAGFVVEVAENGEIALAMLAKATYDAVLMDMQMPVMDGLAATIAIRKDPALSGLPVIAMTANAMRQDRERCLAVGMNGFLAKPIDPDELFDTLATWIKPRPPVPGQPPAKADPAPGSACDETVLPERIDGLDMAAGLIRLGGKRALYRRLLLKMRRDFPEMARQLRQALNDGRIKEAEIVAHSVKGSAGNVGGNALQEAAAVLETALRHPEADGTPPKALADFEATLSAFVEALTVLGPDEAPAPPCLDATGSATPPGGLRRALADLTVQLAKRKPKPCRQSLDALKALGWPQALADDLARLEARLGKYDFQGALDITKELEQALATAPPPLPATTPLPPEIATALTALLPHLQNRRPKPCAEAMAQLAALPATPALAEAIARLGELVGRYKFAEAAAAVTTLFERGTS